MSAQDPTVSNSPGELTQSPLSNLLPLCGPQPSSSPDVLESRLGQQLRHCEVQKGSQLQNCDETPRFVPGTTCLCQASPRQGPQGQLPGETPSRARTRKCKINFLCLLLFNSTSAWKQVLQTPYTSMTKEQSFLSDKLLLLFPIPSPSKGPTKGARLCQAGQGFSILV